MSLLSLKGRILLGAVLWTNGLFAISGVILHVVMFDHSSDHSASHSSARVMSHWTFLQHAPITALIGLLCMVFGFLQVRRGMSPLDELRHQLAAVHKGTSTRVSGKYPAEVQPLVHDLNVLLEEREQRIARAIAKAGDLAHALKTPLAVLRQEAEQARTAGHEQLAAEMDEQIDRMKRQIDYHLAQARSVASAASPAARASIAESAEALARTLRRLHSERDIRIEINAPVAHCFRGQREDLDEMLGNLLDNACKWARTQVRLTCFNEGEQIVIAIDDDGPGIEPSMRGNVIQCGVRADETAPGSGLGLAIVRDLAAIYGGSISLEDSPIGGLRARLTLPAQSGL